MSSMLNAVLAFIILITSLIFTQVFGSSILSKHAPPILNQLSFFGFLPLTALRMPSYPLMHINLLLFVTMSTLNAVFMVKTKQHFVFFFIVISIFALLINGYNEVEYESQKAEDRNAFYDQLNLYEAPGLLLPRNRSPAYLVHFFIVMAIYAASIALASRHIYTSMRSFNAFARMQLDHVYEMVGLESEPYIVTKVVDQIVLPPSKIGNLNHLSELSHELGFKLTFVSEEF